MFVSIETHRYTFTVHIYTFALMFYNYKSSRGMYTIIKKAFVGDSVKKVMLAR